MKKSRLTLVSILGVLVVAIIATVLVVKHNSNGTSANGQSSNGKQIKLSQVLSEKKDRLWFTFTSDDDNGITRKSNVYTVYVTNNGKMTEYNTKGELTIKDISKLSDKQIIDKVKKLDKKDFLKQLADEKESVQYDIDQNTKDNDTYDYANTGDTDEEIAEQRSENSEDIANHQAYVDKLNKVKYQAPKAVKIKLNAYDNGSTQDVIKETFSYPKKVLVTSSEYDFEEGGPVYALPDYEDDYDINFETPVYPTVVDKVIYGGISDKKGEDTLYTRVKKGQTIILDSYKDKYVVNKGEVDN